MVRERKRARGIGKRNLPDGYESLGTIWNPEVAPRSTAVMDKSSRGEKLNVELVSNHFRKRIVPSEQLSINFRRACERQRGENIFLLAGQMCRHAFHFLFMRSGKSAVKVLQRLEIKFSTYELGCSCLSWEYLLVHD